MEHLFDPDSPPVAMEWQQGTVFDRAAPIIERLELGHRKGGAKAAPERQVPGRQNTVRMPRRLGAGWQGFRLYGHGIDRYVLD